MDSWKTCYPWEWTAKNWQEEKGNPSHIISYFSSIDALHLYNTYIYYKRAVDKVLNILFQWDNIIAWKNVFTIRIVYKNSKSHLSRLGSSQNRIDKHEHVLNTLKDILHPAIKSIYSKYYKPHQALNIYHLVLKLLSHSCFIYKYNKIWSILCHIQFSTRKLTLHHWQFSKWKAYWWDY